MQKYRAISLLQNLISHALVDQRMHSTLTLLEHQLRRHVWDACVQVEYVSGPVSIDRFELVIANDIREQDLKLIGSEEPPRTADLLARRIRY
jgi:hypothetical protein